MNLEVEITNHGIAENCLDQIIKFKCDTCGCEFETPLKRCKIESGRFMGFDDGYSLHVSHKCPECRNWCTVIKHKKRDEKDGKYGKYYLG